MLKHLELKQSRSCLNKAGATEPIFVLRAKDPLFAQTVRLWAEMAHGVHEDSKRDEALQLADEGEAWRNTQPAEATAAGNTIRGADPSQQNRNSALR